MRWTITLCVVCLTVLLAGCSTARRAPGWAIALHGGAGTLSKTSPAHEQAMYRASLERALRAGVERLERGDAAVDVAQAVVMMLEDDANFNAGKGAAFNEQGKHELDASIMDGSTLRCGAVAGVRTVKNPIGLARLVMDRTKHVLLMGDGAEQFADAMNVPRVPNDYFSTPKRREMLDEVLRERAQQRSGAAPKPHATYGTVGCVVRDSQGRLAAATSTGGLTGKRFGRVGDSPIIGAGTYADAHAAVSCTGTGEEFIRHGVARSVSARVAFAGQSLRRAVNEVVFETLRPDDGGLIAIDSRGNIAAMYNSEGMYRAWATHAGTFKVAIFEEESCD
jgi:L-asparaginase / beta-aspartyl-peptidase